MTVENGSALEGWSVHSMALENLLSGVDAAKETWSKTVRSGRNGLPSKRTKRQPSWRF